MKLLSTFIITLTDRDLQLAACNSGLTITLPAETKELVIRVEREEEKKSEHPFPGEAEVGRWPQKH